jgi:hypothetical protein
MRFFRLTQMAHILSLIVLMSAAMPFVGSGAGSPHNAQDDVVAMDVRDCAERLMSGDAISGCPNMMVHCVTFANLGHALPEPTALVIPVYHRSHAVDADSLTQDPMSPPPRA